MHGTSPHDTGSQEHGAAMLGAVVRRRCQQIGVTLSDVAIQSRMTRAYLHRLMNGKTANPGVLTLQRLASALQLPASALFRFFGQGVGPTSATAKRHVGLRDADDGMVFVADVTVPDHALMTPGEVFRKTWCLQNAGNQVWVGRMLQRVDSDVLLATRSGPGELLPLLNVHIQSLGSQIEVPMTQPGHFADLSVDMKAPEGSGTVASVWRMVDADGHPCFGPQCCLYTVVTVVGW